MNNAVTIVTSLMAVFSALGSAYLVYRASSNNTRVAHEGQSFTQQQATIDGLREDVAELDNQRRAYYAENVRLLQTIEKYRAWGYGLVRLLTDNNVSDIPPEPSDVPPLP